MANGPFTADIPGAFQRGLQFRQAEQLRPIQQQAAQLGAEQQQQSLRLGGLQQQQAQANILGTQQSNVRGEEVAILERNINTAIELKATPDNKKPDFLRQKIQHGESLGRDMSQSKKALQLVESGRFQELSTGTDALIKVGEKIGILTATKQAPSGQREFESLTKGLTEDQKNEAVLIKLGINPRAVSSADITIAESPELTNQIANSKAVIGERKKFGELTGSSRAKKIDAGFEKIAKIDAGIGNIDRAIKALNSGAGVGAIEKFLPSFKAASVELDNIQKSMALDVIGAVTFGALSQGELNLAKEVALPTGLNTAELIQHLQNRKTSQEKLRAYFNEQIQFLDQGGTVAGFLRQQERNAPQQPAAAQLSSGDLSQSEQAELAELERQFGGQ